MIQIVIQNSDIVKDLNGSNAVNKEICSLEKIS